MCTAPLLFDEPSPPQTWPKLCSCGVEYSREAFAALPLCGRQDDGVDFLELRNCPCHSTIAIVLERT